MATLSADSSDRVTSSSPSHEGTNEETPLLNTISPKVKDNFKAYVAGAIILLLSILLLTTNIPGYARIVFQPLGDSSSCPVYPAIAPASFHSDNSTVLDILFDEKFRLQSVQKLSGAVQVDTTVGDNQPDVPDAPEVWESFAEFHKYLKKTFPTVFAKLDVHYVNTYGLVLHWKGSDESLKPLMLAAHQDVVPVQHDTLSYWTYPPFEGHYDGKYVYGRGSSDCKNILIGILEALELLVHQNFKPKRGIIAAFGFDEEASGLRGAAQIGKFLETTFGKDSIYAIIDEGAGIMRDKQSGQIIAVAATGEKGYIDVKISLTTPGGHSSVPPDHTSIGIISELAYLLESEPYEPILSVKNPILKYLQCLAVNTGDSLPKMTRKAILRAGFDKFANSLVVKGFAKDLATRYLVQTSQALDLLTGGEKANALPENVQLVVNHRVAVESNLEMIEEHFSERVFRVAEKHNLTLDSFGKRLRTGSKEKGSFKVERFSKALEPAPISPSEGSVWEHLAGVTRHIFEDIVFPDTKYPIYLTPAVMPANTDTRYYWNLTKNIFRYSPYFSEDVMKENNIHSVDEKIRVDGHLQLLAWFYEYIQVADVAKGN